jgi:hypothetical protein
MRHIPEDELHAYLDQGLSRTQCVEIESHLAVCPSCAAMRDGIAALRDRTTALLAQLAPARAIPPAFEVLRDRAVAAASERRRRLHLAAWVASLVAAVGFGWSASAWLGPAARLLGSASDAPPATVAAATAPPIVVEAPARAMSSQPAVTTPAPRRTRAPIPATTSVARDVPADSTLPTPKLAAALPPLRPAPTLELTQLDKPNAANELEMSGMWRTMSWDGARAAAGERLPHIDGLPVVQVQVQNREEGARPLMVVAQQLASGQVIRTIEGPVTEVSQLLSRRAMSDPDSFALRGDSSGRSDPHAMAMQVGDRMLAITGDLPSDSLRAMIRRLNAEMRSK